MGCLMMQMLPANLEEGIRAPGVNFGIFTRRTREQARREAKLFFPDSIEHRELLKYTMENTDSIWKRRLKEAGQTGELHENGYWLLPFLPYRAGCSYPGGNYCAILAKLGRLSEKIR